MLTSTMLNAQDTSLTPEYLSTILVEARKKFNLPAITVAVMNSKTIWFQEVQGVRKINKPDQATLDDYFHIGSCSKSVLAVMAAQLIEQKIITWQTRFFDIFPELKEDAIESYLHITLEDLFLCEAGIKAYTNSEEEPLPEYGLSESDPRLTFIHFLVQQPPSSKPQQDKKRFQHLYSNASYTMVAAMLERVTGKKYEELVRTTLTDDLGLSVILGWPNRISPDQPWGHTSLNKTIEALGPGHEYRIPHLIIPAGDLSMTPRDYARYTQLHLQGLRGIDNFISSDAYKYIHFGHKGFSLGVGNGALGGKIFSGFDGSAGTFFCRTIILLEPDLALCIMTNIGSSTGYVQAVEWLTMRIAKKHFNWWWKFWL